MCQLKLIEISLNQFFILACLLRLKEIKELAFIFHFALFGFLRCFLPNISNFSMISQLTAEYFDYLDLRLNQGRCLISLEGIFYLFKDHVTHHRIGW